MTNPHSPIDPAVLELHELIESGSVVDIRVALANSALINAPGHVGRTALIEAISTKDIEKVRLLIELGADVEITDDFNSTPLSHAVQDDFPAAVELLLSHHVDRGYHPKYPLKKIEPPKQIFQPELPEELKQVFTEEQWRQQLDKTQELLREHWENPKVRPVISDVDSVEVLKLLLAAGDDVNLAPNEVKRAWVGLKPETEFRSNKSDYQQHKNPSYGKSNPELMNFAFWQDMIRRGGNSYAARTHFGDESPFSVPGAVWCFDRFGSALVPLPDGRFVQIAGEHEDHYDPDFFIYNDVVVHDGKGEFQIYGYPKDIFPPTDFHSATLCPDGIYIIGCLGYMDQRQQGFTPVYRLSLDTWKIEKVETFGEMPGWIHRHQATYDAGRNRVTIARGEIDAATADGTTDLIPNPDRFELNLADFTWKKLD
ncbi:ankyrin repeat domain-containing protein [Planctomicrobium sp. SH661]|uniref:ankyrin repeat domain-containing protein n=1 Tax=Planctomicrobium sp. SH661 TaxID=3448124 RepID=UPI003F5BAD37